MRYMYMCIMITLQLYLSYKIIYIPLPKISSVSAKNIIHEQKKSCFTHGLSNIGPRYSRPISRTSKKIESFNLKACIFV